MDKDISEAPFKQLPEFMVLAVHGQALKPDGSAIALLLVDRERPDSMLPLILWRPEAQNLLEKLTAFLAQPPLAGRSGTPTAHH